MMVKLFVLTKGGGHNILQQILAKTVLLLIQLLPHFLTHSEKKVRPVFLCVGVVYYLSSIVLDAELVVIHSGLHIIWVRLWRKDTNF